MTSTGKTPARKAPAGTRDRLPEIGALVRDRETGWVGVLMALARDTEPGKHPGPNSPVKAYLRPVGGGREWTAWPWDVEPVEEGGR
jgi:hypothetical protein